MPGEESRAGSPAMSQIDALTGWIAAALFTVALAASLVNRWRLAEGRSFSSLGRWNLGAAPYGL